jgi:hypothetical protein
VAPCTGMQYATFQHPLPPAYAPLLIEQEQSFDTIACQKAAGYRAAWPLMAGLTGGGAKGIDLLPQECLVHHAQQVPIEILAPGPLVTAQPAGILLPVSSYAPLLYCTGASAAGDVLPSPIGLPPQLYRTAQRIISGSGVEGGVGNGSGESGQCRMDAAYISDELNIQHSTGFLGSLSPYSSASLQRDLTCMECQALQHH